MANEKENKVKKPFYKKWWVWLAAIIIIVAATSGGEEGTETAGTTPTETSAAETGGTEEAPKEEPKEEAKTFGIGEEVTVGKITYVVNGIEETQVIESVLGDKTTENSYVIVDMSIKNGDKEARFIDAEMFRILTADGTEYSADSEMGMYVNDGGLGFFLEEINPNISKSGKVVFELPAGTEAFDLQVSSGFGWSGGEYQNIKLK